MKVKIKIFYNNLSLRYKIHYGCFFFYSENNEIFLYYEDIEFNNLDVSFNLLNGILNIIKEYPNTFLLFLTLFPILKIYKRLNIMFTNKFKNVGNNEEVLPMYRYTYKYSFFLGFWMFIGVIIFLIYPNETELLKEYLPQYHSLTTNDYKLIKISFGILANLLALITSWYFSNLKKWINLFPIFGLLWSCILCIDILYYPDLIVSGTLYISNSLGILGIITGLSNLEISGRKWQCNAVDNNNGDSNKLADDNTPNDNNVVDRGRIKRRRKLIWLRHLRFSTHLEKDPLLDIPEEYDLTDFSNKVVWEREHRESEFWRPRRYMLKPLYRYIPYGHKSDGPPVSDPDTRVYLDPTRVSTAPPVPESPNDGS